jgi:hypothetical protein
MIGAAAGAGAGSVLGQVSDLLSKPRRFLWSDLLGLPESGSELVANALGMDPDSPWTHALGLGAEMLGDPLTYAGSLLGGLAGSAKGRAVGREVGSLLGEMGGDVANALKGAPDAFAANGARRGILSLPSDYEAVSQATHPLNLLQDIRLDAAESPSRAAGLMDAQKGVWGDFFAGHGFPGLHSSYFGVGDEGIERVASAMNPADWKEVAARMVEQDTDRRVLDLLRRGFIASDPGGPQNQILRNAELALQDKLGESGLNRSVSSLFHSTDRPSVDAWRQQMRDNSAYGVIERALGAGPRPFPDPKAMPGVLDALAAEGHRLPAEAMMQSAVNNVPPDIQRLTTRAAGEMQRWFDSSLRPPFYGEAAGYRGGPVSPGLLQHLQRNYGRYLDYAPDELNVLIQESSQNPWVRELLRIAQQG